MTDPTVAVIGDVDILSFDSVSDAERGIELEMLMPDEITRTGVYLNILGANADPVSKWVNAIVNKSIKERAMAVRKGKAVEPMTLEETNEQNIQGAAIRVSGWRGPKQPFDRELLIRALRRNPHWVQRIIRESENAGNFLTAQQTS